MSYVIMLIGTLISGIGQQVGWGQKKMINVANQCDKEKDLGWGFSYLVF